MDKVRFLGQTVEVGSTMETAFSCTKQAMGFHFLKMQGLCGTQTEWQLARLAWNLKRMFSLCGTSLT